jgi:DNA mismatch repair protein MutL
MSGIIQLLSDAVANQIAAGEVIQRPASVVKELVENAVDAGADSITVNVKDAGKTLIQVIDNGCGMSETDARICWERHATSKIRDAADLFAIRTKGFRGEALASIAAISEVALKTKRTEDELGTQIKISASSIISNEPVACQQGSNFQIKNLFYNIPARRKFLKSNSTELRHIINEFNHISLTHPSIEFNLIHNNSQILNLPKTNLRQRIISVMGKSLNQSLINLESSTSLINIKGFIGKPEFARKTYGEQYFFVNQRYIRHPYLHKAVVQAYEQILPTDSIPSYFIFFEIEPDKIDINIHPTKTEIKFEDEPAIWQILHAVTRESIGKNNLSPSIDFDTNGVIGIPVMRKDTVINTPRENIDLSFNPFEVENQSGKAYSRPEYRPKTPPQSWEKLYEDINTDKNTDSNSQTRIESEVNHDSNRLLQFKNKFILTPIKSGLMIIDQKRAHERILYEQNLQSLQNKKGSAQQTLFPETIELNHSDFVSFTEILDNLLFLGFDIRDFGNNTIIVHGIPEYVKSSDIKSLIDQLLENFKSFEGDPKLEIIEKIAISAAKASAIPYGKVLEIREMKELVDQLFGCLNPNHSPTGKNIISILQTDEIEKILNRS